MSSKQSTCLVTMEEIMNFLDDLESDCSEISEDETSSSIGWYIMKVYLCIIG